MKNSLFFLLLILSCGNAFALPQDWPCFGLNIKKYKTISKKDGVFEYSYNGETKGYNLNINLSGISEIPTSFADCGNSGCLGTISNKATGKTENLRFFCEENNNDYKEATCYINFGDEAIFSNGDNGNYILSYCSDNKQKSLRFNVKDCNKCHCKMYWYNGDTRNTSGEYNMACKKEGNKLHCFTYHGYELWRNFQNKYEDFQNCVKLGL